MPPRHQILANVIPYSILERRNLLIETRLPQLMNVRAGEVLISAAQFLRHVDELDLRLAAKRIEDGMGQLHPGMRLARADVEQSTSIYLFPPTERRRPGAF